MTQYSSTQSEVKSYFGAASIVNALSFDNAENGVCETVKPMRYALFGDRNKPLALVMGGISSSRLIVSTEYGEGWWDQLVGYDKAIDLNDYCVLGVDFYSPEFLVDITPEDQAKLINDLLEEIGFDGFELIVGSSYGGLVAQSFAANYPQSVGQLILLCAASTHTNKSVALRYIQQKIMSSLPNDEGLKLARSLAMLGYRSDAELERRFSQEAFFRGQSQEFEIVEYLQHNANKFQKRFERFRYQNLSRSIDLHQVDESKVKCPSLLIGFDSDQLVTTNLIKKTCQAIGDNSYYREIQTEYGHDGFLKEVVAIENLINEFLGKNDESN